MQSSVLNLRVGVRLALLFVSVVSLRAQTISTLVSVPPCRIIDTRDPAGPFGAPSLQSGGTRDIPIPSSTCGIPSNAAAYSINVTVVPHGAFDYLTIWPSGQPMPLASTLNAYAGTVTANAAIVPAGAGGSISVFCTGSTDLILDINGYFAVQQLPTQQASVISQSSSSITLNTAIGSGASSAGGALNTAVGANALAANGDGTYNTAVGAGALAAHSTGSENTAVGANALANSSNGTFDTALGSHSLENNTIGNGNTAIGYYSLVTNNVGLSNTAVGAYSLQSVTSGTHNIGIGDSAGANLTDGSFNIDIGHPGVAHEAGVIRIGSSGLQNSIFIPVIRNNAINGATVIVDTNGKLGIQVSSRRYKEDIQDLGDISRDIFKLRPVQFRYKKALDDGTKPLQYGLIAEEVDAVYPEMVFHNAKGEIEGVAYQQLPALLLNEIQNQQQRIASQDDAIQKLLLRVEALESQAGTAALSRQ